MHREANRPWPVISDDPVIDYMVMEAVAIKARKEDEKLQEEAAKQKERDDFKSDFSDLDQFR